MFNRIDFAAASRDLSDYVITERWRDVEQALDNDTHILPIWLAWGSTRSEVSNAYTWNSEVMFCPVDQTNLQIKIKKRSPIIITGLKSELNVLLIWLACSFFLYCVLVHIVRFYSYEFLA